MYKSSYDGGLSKKDIKRIKEIVNKINADFARKDLKDEKFVEGYIQGRKSVINEISDITEDLYQFAFDIEDTAPDIAYMIEQYADRFSEFIGDLEQGE